MYMYIAVHSSYIRSVGLRGVVVGMVINADLEVNFLVQFLFLGSVIVSVIVNRSMRLIKVERDGCT